jgi:hypothetical protein
MENLGTATANVRSTMKRSITLFALVAVISAPMALAAELAGLPVPAALDASSIFSGFIFAVLGLTAFSDYTRRRPALLRVSAAATAPIARSAHPLAA